MWKIQIFCFDLEFSKIMYELTVNLIQLIYYNEWLPAHYFYLYFDYLLLEKNINLQTFLQEI